VAWADWRRKIVKYKPFLDYDVKNIRSIVEAHQDENT
jgi:hypothetical protein